VNEAPGLFNVLLFKFWLDIMDNNLKFSLFVFYKNVKNANFHIIVLCIVLSLASRNISRTAVDDCRKNKKLRNEMTAKHAFSAFKTVRHCPEIIKINSIKKLELLRFETIETFLVQCNVMS
jgi:hypothetical protein